MSLLVFLAVTLLGTGAHPLTIVDEFGKPVAAARVDFSDERGAHDLETSDALGSVAAREGFVPLAAEISAVGFATLRVDLRTSGERIALLHSLPVVGTVSVATGTQSSLHELPLAASVLDRNAIALSPSLATDALLRQLPGFDRIRSNSAFTNYGQLRVSFAGAGTDLGVVIADGLPAQDGFGGQVDWLAYPVQSLQSAELLRGAGSALYGSGAIGGVLSLTTFAPRTGSQGAEGRAMLGAGTNSSFDDGIQLSVPLGPTLAASASTATTGMSYFTLPPGYSSSRDHAAKGNSDATNVKLRYDDGATSIEAGGLFAWDAQDEGRTNYSFNRSLSQGGIVANHAIGAALAQFWYYERSVSILNVADLYPTHPGALRYVQNVPTNEQGYAATIGTPLSKNTALEVFVEQRDIAGVSTQHGPKDVLQALGSGTEIVGAAGLQATLRLSRFELLAGV